MRHYSNGWASAITSAPNGSATSITPASVTGAPATPFDARIRNATLTADGLHYTKEEIVSVTNITSGVCTITRASEAIWDGTQSAVDFTGGPAVLEHEFTAGGIAEMSALRVIYAECNTPPTGTATLLWDKFYDQSQAQVTGATLTALLAELGLTYNSGSGVFTATANMALAIQMSMVIAATPGGTDVVTVYNPSFAYFPQVSIPSPNTLGQASLGEVLPILSGQTFSGHQQCAGANTPLTYAAMNIVRLV